MATLDKAIAIAAQAHLGQKDKQGEPYIVHPFRVMQNVQGDDARMIAILHDVIEDTSTTEDDLRKAGFSDLVISGVLSVSRRDGESYTDFVIRSAAHELGRLVKMADIEDNSRAIRSIFRLESSEKDLARMKRYFLSYQFLRGRMPEDEYRRLMDGQ